MVECIARTTAYLSELWHGRSQSIAIPRKQRTRQHVIADLSTHFVEGFILEEGHTAQRLMQDYGYDLIIFTYDGRGYVEPGFISVQIKASESLQQVGSQYAFDLDIRDYNLWTVEKMPVILVLFDAGRRRAYWIAVQDYFLKRGRPGKGAKSVRVLIDKKQPVKRRSIEHMRRLKNALYGRLRELQQ
jgi:hypothetical protein